MRPLQDKCEPSSIEDIDKMFVSDEGMSLSDMFDEFNAQPIGVASLAQVHVGKLKGTGQEVAVKVRDMISRAQFMMIDSRLAATSSLARIL